ncbi:patatin-like phospholipase family protein [Daejeonella oryzae]|uniref:patatin-like phospholipase family protein n=1 Tax=Daejeonella oryzae TaxID=1122943 RepID=UPI000415E3A8|nr:patatin-like phospholipase family protein [Daejeonella oryzae]
MSYKILSMDGGGSWAIIQARVLMDIYGDIGGHELLRKFDMVIANSGGSLILACMCNDMRLSEIITVFSHQPNREQVFSNLTFWEKLKITNLISFLRAKTTIGPKYSTDRKLSGLIKILKQNDHLFNDKIISAPIVETPLLELPDIIKKSDLQILIVGFDYFRERVSFFRSNTGSNTDKFSKGKYYSITLAHAIHASSNAPINYFDSPAAVKVNLLNGNDTRKTWFWDGAVSGFNNPVLAAVIEAITNNHSDPKELCILSLGTGTGGRAIINDYENSTNPTISAIYRTNKTNPLAQTDNTFNFLRDVKKMSTSILGDPPDSASFIAYSILDPGLSNKANLIRINPCIKPELDSNNYFILPQVYKEDTNGMDKFIKLIDMDMDAVKQEEVDLITDLCDKFIIDIDKPSLPNQFIRGDSQNGLGFGTYREAKEKWLPFI